MGMSTGKDVGSIIVNFLKKRLGDKLSVEDAYYSSNTNDIKIPLILKIKNINMQDEQVFFDILRKEAMEVFSENSFAKEKRAELYENNEILKSKNAELEAQNSDLLKYKNYYDLAKELVNKQ